MLWYTSVHMQTSVKGTFLQAGRVKVGLKLVFLRLEANLFEMKPRAG